MVTMRATEAIERIGMHKVLFERYYRDREFDMVEVMAIKNRYALNKLELLDRLYSYKETRDKLVEEIANELG